MDFNFLGLPKEGWGLSQNIIPVFALPSFDECAFKFDKKEKYVKILIRY